MTTTYRLSTKEIDNEFLESVRLLYSNREVEITIKEIGSDIDDNDWLSATLKNEAFHFLNEEEEDIYSLDDGKPVSDEK